MKKLFYSAPAPAAPATRQPCQRWFPIQSLCLAAVFALNQAGSPAQTLYDAGPWRGQTDGTVIFFGNWFGKFEDKALADSFTLATNSVICSASVVMDTDYNITLTSLSWEITSAPFGPILASGSASSFNQSILAYLNVQVANYQFQIPPVALPAGQYYFALIAANTADNGYAYWEASAWGLSRYYQLNDPLVNNSEAFQLYGSAGPTFEISGLISATNGVQLSVLAPSDLPYRLWATTNLSLTPVTNTWRLVFSGVGTGVPAVVNDANAKAGPRQIYIGTLP